MHGHFPEIGEEEELGFVEPEIQEEHDKRLGRIAAKSHGGHSGSGGHGEGGSHAAGGHSGGGKGILHGR